MSCWASSIQESFRYTSAEVLLLWQLRYGFRIQCTSTLCFAGSSRNFQDSIIIDSNSGTTITYVEGAEHAYLGFCTVRYVEPPLDPMRVGNGQHLCSALVVNAFASPLIEHCSFSSTCSGLSQFLSLFLLVNNI